MRVYPELIALILLVWRAHSHHVQARAYSKFNTELEQCWHNITSLTTSWLVLFSPCQSLVSMIMKSQLENWIGCPVDATTLLCPPRWIRILPQPLLHEGKETQSQRALLPGMLGKPLVLRSESESHARLAPREERWRECSSLMPPLWNQKLLMKRQAQMCELSKVWFPFLHVT